MIIYPAIDIKDEKCVRLSQGKFDDVTVFSDEPATVAKNWQDAGAKFIHVVDLDGARFGAAKSNKTIENILSAISVPIQVGGGIRTMEDIASKINMGVSRVILGTASVKTAGFVAEAVAKYGNKIAVGVDAKDGKVAVSGWEEVSEIDALEFCLEMKKLGVQTIIYTDIAKDGMMSGPNITQTKQIIDATGIDIIASGGVSTFADLEACERIGSHGAIIGKALYNGAIDLKQAVNKYN